MQVRGGALDARTGNGYHTIKLNRIEERQNAAESF